MNSETKELGRRPLCPRGLRLHASDNVVTLLDNGSPGPLEILGDSSGATVEVIETVAAGHKASLGRIAAGAPIVKYGVTIGLATEPIAAGAWVHTHNCKSRLDERSHTLDRHSGAATDTPYV